jgi:hypothetical protein
LADSASQIAALRALDWRFLLPTPVGARFRRLAILGGVAGVEARARLAGIADEVSTALPDAGYADAVVAFGDATARLSSIATSLADDGCLYLEVDRGRSVRATTPGRIAAELREAGVFAHAFYMREPTAPDPRAFIPLDPPEPASWHRRTVFGNRATIRLATIVRQSAVRIGGPTLAAFDRPFAVIGTRQPDDGGLPGALRHPDIASRLGTPRIQASVMLAYGEDRVLLFPFAEGGAEPVGVVKIPKAAALVGRTENEQACMRDLRARLDASLAAAIPEPLGLVGLSNTVAACERYVAGRSVAARAMDSSLPLREKSADLELAMSWLAQFHRATETGRATVRESWDEWLAGYIDTYDREIGDSASAPLLRRLRSARDSLGDLRIATATVHRDFAAWNVVLGDGGLAVVDWEGAREGVACVDAIHLATTWLYSHRLSEGVDDESRCVRDLLGDATRSSDAAVVSARRTLAAYFDALALDRRLTSFAIAVHRIELATRRADQRRLLGAIAEPADSLAEVRIVRELARDAERLWSGAGW